MKVLYLEWYPDYSEFFYLFSSLSSRVVLNIVIWLLLFTLRVAYVSRSLTYPTSHSKFFTLPITMSSSLYSARCYTEFFSHTIGLRPRRMLYMLCVSTHRKDKFIGF